MQEAVMEVLTAIAVTAALYIANEGLKKLMEFADGWLVKAKEEAGRKDNEMAVKLFETARSLVDTTVYNAVAAMEQTKAKDIRAAVKNGFKNRGELEILATDVLYEIKDQLTPDVVRIMNGYVKDLDKYIQNQIESSLLMIKNASPYIDLPAELLETGNDWINGTDGNDAAKA